MTKASFGVIFAAALCVAACLPADKNKVTIKRDAYGMAHIFAANNKGLFYGYGYALAQDRLFQLEILRRSAQGRVAEVLGADYASFDENQRRLFWPDDIRAQLDALPKRKRVIFSAFADGINAQLEMVAQDPEKLMPAEFTHYDFTPTTWTDYDAAMLFVGTMMLRYGDFNSEMQNQQFLADLTEKHGAQKAMQIFNDALPLNHADAPSTIISPKAAQLSPRPKINMPPIIEAYAQADINTPPPTGFSNALILGENYLRDHAALLLNGPQFGWAIPAYTYSFGFHSPKWKAVGNAPLGYLFPMFGHNAHIAWGSTWAARDNVDIFRETLNPDNPRQYKHRGKWKNFDAREETIRVRDGDDITFTALKSVHGPVFMQDDSHAYARQRGWQGRELETLLGWQAATQAKNFNQWRKAVSLSAVNVNWYYADKSGNIGYFSSGRFPKRAPDHDRRLPVSGEGQMDWRGLQSAMSNPHILNPPENYVANWNNRPSANSGNPDQWWYSWSQADRIWVMRDGLAAATTNKKLSADEAWDLMLAFSFDDPNVRFFRPHMLAALDQIVQDTRGGRALYRKIAQRLANWDGRFEATTKPAQKTADKGRGTAKSNGNAYAQSANTIFRHWLAAMQRAVLADDMAGMVGTALSTDTGYATLEKPSVSGLNISVGLKLLYEILEGRSAYDFLNGQNVTALWKQSLDVALEEMRTTYGNNMDNWQMPVTETHFHYKNFLGVPQTLPSAAREDIVDMNRGTQNNMVAFDREGNVQSFEVVAPGQSGFIAPDNNATAPHYDDQYQLFAARGKKRIWFTTADITANTASETVLQMPKAK